MKILNKPSATKEQVYAWLETKEHHPIAESMIEIFFDIAQKEGVDPVVVIAQAMKETGYFRFRGVLKPNFCNTCGLKISRGGGDTDPNAHRRFDYWEDGILAHVQHIALYAGAPGYPKENPMDPRHFGYLLGKCPNVEDLSCNWAPSKTYGQDIVAMCESIINTVPKKDETLLNYEKKILELQHEIEENNKQISTLKDKGVKFDNLKKSIEDILK